MKLQTKIGLGQLLFSLTFFILSSIGIYWVVEKAVYHELDEHLRYHKRDILREINEGYISVDEILRLTKMGTVEWIRVHPVKSEGTPQDRFETLEFAPTDTSRAQEYRVLHTNFQLEGQVYQFDIFEESSRWDTILRTIIIAVIGAIFVWSILLYMLNWSLFSHLLKPFYRTVSYLTDIHGPNDYDRPFAQSSTDEIQKLNSALNRTFSQLKSAFAQQKEFIQNASHELLTPLSIIQQKSELLMSEPQANESTVQRASQIYDTSKRMERLSQALLMISKIENQQYETAAAVSIVEVMDEVDEELAILKESKELKLVTNWQDPPRIRANRELLHSLFKNILHNAAKYSPTGGQITISGNPAGSNRYEVHITDQGPGIPEEVREQVFQRFSKANQSWSDSPGLGLAIARSICDFHNWTCELDNAQGENEGAVFRIVFPLS